MAGVYIIRNCKNGKVYVGSTVGPFQHRWGEHKRQLRKGLHRNYHLQAAWNLYGESQFRFESIQECPAIDCTRLEQKFIDALGACNPNLGYNINPTAGSNSGAKIPGVGLANKRRIYDSSKQAAKVRGLKRSEATRQKMAEARRKYWACPEHRIQASNRTTSWWKDRAVKGKLEPRKETPVVDFARQLIESLDLDPLYVALWKSQISRRQLSRFLVAYFCFYHAGLSCWLSEQPKFFEAMLHVARSGTKYPRGTERRHFRGNLAIRSIANLSSQFSSAEELVDWLIDAGPRADAVMKRVKTLYGFGEWICWKVPDMLERLGLAKIQFVDRDVDLMFPSVQEGALEVSRRYSPGDDPLMRAHRYLLQNLGRLKAPPKYDRPLNVQETETIFCKWKSHLNGHYPVGKDSREIREGLFRFARCRTTQTLLRVLPRAKGGG